MSNLAAADAAAVHLTCLRLVAIMVHLTWLIKMTPVGSSLQSDDDGSDADEVAAPAAAAAAGRARRAVATKSYVLSESEEEGDDSDFAESP